MTQTADLLIKNGRSGRSAQRDGAKGRISPSRTGRSPPFPGPSAREVIDARAVYVSCGFIESHLHVEGLHLLPGHYFQGLSRPRHHHHRYRPSRGRPTRAAWQGLRWYLSLWSSCPSTFSSWRPPACPSSPFEARCGRLGVERAEAAKAMRRVIGLGEVMDVEAVMGRQKAVMGKIALFEGGRWTAMRPGSSGSDLDRYMSAGIHSDHETTGADEGAEKLSRRHAPFPAGGLRGQRPSTSCFPSSALENLGRASPFARTTFPPATLSRQATSTALVSRLVSSGVPLFHALRLVTANPAPISTSNDRSCPRLGEEGGPRGL